MGTTTTTTTTATTLPPGLPPEHCPEPKTCRRYTFVDGAPHRWPTGPDGRVTIAYAINPQGANTTYISVEQIEGAFRAAFDTWERAAPVLNFVYQGRTTRSGTPGDGVNVIAFNGATIEHTVTTGGKEFDVLLTPNGWTWARCPQADNACTPHKVKDDTTPGVTFVPRDLQGIGTHAVGHALWLGDMEDRELDRNLTMFPGDQDESSASRFRQTLALGDVLGVRALYPCSCPLPPIYDP